MSTNSGTGRTAYANLSALIGARVEVATMKGMTGVISGALLHRYTPKYVVLLESGDVKEFTTKAIRIVHPAATMASIARSGKALETPWLATPKPTPAPTKSKPAAKSKLRSAGLLAAAADDN